MNDEIELKRKNNRDRQRRFRARLRCIAENKPIPDEFALLTESRKPKSRKPKYDDRLTEDEKKEFQRKRQREYNWRFHGRLWFISQGKPIPDEFARWRKRRKPSYDDNAVKRKGEREKDDAALLMMEEHSTSLCHQSKEIQRIGEREKDGEMVPKTEPKEIGREARRRFRARLRCIAQKKPIPDELRLRKRGPKPKYECYAVKRIGEREKDGEMVSNTEPKKNAKRKRSDISCKERNSHAPSLAVQAALLMMKEHSTLLGHQSKEIQRIGEREKDGEMVPNTVPKQDAKPIRSDINCKERDNHAPSLAFQSALLMMEEHSTLLGHQSKVIQRMLANPIECKELAEASSRTVMNPQFQLDDDDPLHEVVYLSKQLKKIKREIRGKRKELEAVQACDDDEMALFRFNNDRSERLREWDSSLSWS